jgi:hypothetical protein
MIRYMIHDIHNMIVIMIYDKLRFHDLQTTPTKDLQQL